MFFLLPESWIIQNKGENNPDFDIQCYHLHPGLQPIIVIFDMDELFSL